MGTADAKYHLMLGAPSVKMSTFIPKNVEMKVRGRNMKVILSKVRSQYCLFRPTGGRESVRWFRKGVKIIRILLTS